MNRKALAWGGAVTLAGGLALAVVAGPGLPALGTDQAARPEVTLEFRASEVVRPQRAAMPLELAFSGPLVAPHSVVVRGKAPGTLLTMTVAEGSRVRAGQVLGTLDLAELDSRLGERTAMLGSARAQLAQAERSHAANEALAAQGFISPNALQASRSALDAAQAQWQAAQAQVEAVRVLRRDAALLAPIDGIVAKRHALPGEKLAAEQPVVTLVDLEVLELAGAVGTHEVSRLAPGMPVQVRVEGLDEPRAATLARIAPAAEPGTRSIGVTALLPNPDERLRAGQYAIATVVLDDPMQRLTLPASAITGAAGQEGAWVIDGGVLVRRTVVLGRRDPAAGRVEVLQGIADGDVVLAARFDHLRDGAKALVVDEPAVSAASRSDPRAPAAPAN